MTHDLASSATAARAVAPSQLAWLENELTTWRAAGILDDMQAQAIRGRYVAVRRFSLTKLLLFLGGAIIGVGLLWLVASNLDNMSPLLRFIVVTLVWLGFVATAEILAERRAHRVADRSENGTPVVGAFRLLAALAFGAVVFQAAQSLHVPAYEPKLVGIWGLGALLYAYAVAGVSPLAVGIATITGWYVWHVVEQAQDGMGFVLPVLLAAVIAGAVAVVHAGRWRPSFGTLWREASVLLTLVGLFVAAFPYVDVENFVWSVPVVVGIVTALVAVAVAVVLGTGNARLEPVAPLIAAVAGILLVLWEPPDLGPDAVGAEGYAHALISVAVYVVAAGWYAVVGVRHDSPRMTFIATAALVLFTTVQSFAVFAPIVAGATLFLVLGVIFLGSGYVFDRGRRHLVANLEGASA